MANNNKIKNEDLYSYLVGVIGLSTNVKTKSREILESYKRKLLNISDELRQNIRNSYFKITIKDIKNVSEQVLNQLKQKNSMTSLINNETYENEKRKARRAYWEKIQGKKNILNKKNK